MFLDTIKTFKPLGFNDSMTRHINSKSLIQKDRNLMIPCPAETLILKTLKVKKKSLFENLMSNNFPVPTKSSKTEKTNSYEIESPLLTGTSLCKSKSSSKKGFVVDLNYLIPFKEMVFSN